LDLRLGDLRLGGGHVLGLGASFDLGKFRARRKQAGLGLKQLRGQRALVQHGERVAAMDCAPHVNPDVLDDARAARDHVYLLGRLDRARVAEDAAAWANADRYRAAEQSSSTWRAILP